MPDWKQKLRDALYGIEFYDAALHPHAAGELHRYLIFQQEPTTYLLKLALEAVLGTRLPQRDKKLWVADLVFRGRLWQIDDWKGASWTLYGPPRAETDKEQLLRKLAAAARIVERVMDTEAGVRAGEFALLNQFMRIANYYSYLRQDAEALLTLTIGDEPPRELGITHTPGGGTVIAQEMTAVNNYWEKWQRADAAAAGAVIFFFGLMEIFFDACFALGDRKGINYQEFHRKDWGERFKFVMDVSTKPAADIYANLLQVKDRYRNVFAHASPTFMVLHPLLGWIPAERQRLNEPQMNPMFAFDAKEIQATFALFDQAMQLFEQHDKTWAATLYAKTPLAIPLEPQQVASLMKHATSPETFQQEIDRRIEWMDYYINGGA